MSRPYKIEGSALVLSAGSNAENIEIKTGNGENLYIKNIRNDTIYSMKYNDVVGYNSLTSEQVCKHTNTNQLVNQGTSVSVADTTGGYILAVGGPGNLADSVNMKGGVGFFSRNNTGGPWVQNSTVLTQSTATLLGVCILPRHQTHTTTRYSQLYGLLFINQYLPLPSLT